ncbi:MAG TPA: glycosyltransferase family 1 protein [Tenuifilaceae bacterium]|nr:glycosyltransferase family 1 protein [Tenuifilaceae bacterium]HPJ45954.1 glycosyltransferase family 1 protein [Tenuifilaceae bacterium]
MNIAVNTRFLIHGKLEGIGWFTFETLKRITSMNPQHHYFFLFDRKPHSSFVFSKNITPVVLHPQARHPLLWYIWFELSVPRFIKKNNIDLLVSTDGYIPLNLNIPIVNVIHDINFVHYPDTIPTLSRWYYNHFFPKFAQRATRLVTVSEYSKNDIAKSFNVDPNKIDVVYNGANDAYYPLSQEEKKQAREVVANGNEYFVFVGALSPRKNVARLLKAFDMFCTATMLPYRLVIVGKKLFKTNDITEVYAGMKHKESVIFTGRLEIEELRRIIGGATAMTFVPFFEGFGIPMLEAMGCHIPLIASNRTAMPEVGGDAAYYIDPFSVESIANALKIIATDSKLREALVAKAIEQKKKFSWDSTAKLFNESIQKVISEQYGSFT